MLISRVILAARSAASLRFSCSSSSWGADGRARSTLSRDSSNPRSWVGHGAQRVFTVTDPQPKAGLCRWVHDEGKRAGVCLRDLAKDVWVGWRTFE
jgi:hypothetical protein